MRKAMLAAVLYDSSEGARLEQVARSAIGELEARGVTLAGAVRQEGTGEPSNRCSMMLRDLATGRIIDIAEDRGPLARGCRLNPDALEAAVEMAMAALARGAELLVVNKFGKHEAEGRGYRDAISLALDQGVPVLIAVNREQEAAWQAFSGGLDERLPLDPEAVLTWCREAVSEQESRRAGAPLQVA